MKLEQAITIIKEARAKRAEENHLLDAWTDGFIKACSDRGVDAEALLDILIEPLPAKNTNNSFTKSE